MFKKIAIFGAQGEMGSLFSDVFEKKNIEVIAIEKEEKFSSWEKKISSAEMVILCVPIEKSSILAKKIAPILHSQQIFSDFTSIKKEVIPAMQESKASIISAHPMFGKIKNIKGQKILLLPVKCNKKQLILLEKFYCSLELETQIIKKWQEHDNYMSVIQGLLHFTQICLAETLKEKNLDLKTLLTICSPIYKINFSIASRILLRNPKLYAHILMDNPHNLDFLEAFLEKAKDKLQQVSTKDEKQFLKDFQKTSTFLKKYPKEKEELETLGNLLIEKTQENIRKK